MSQVLVIPLASNSVYSTQLTQIGGVEYLLEFVYEKRFDRWSLNIGQGDGTPIINGLMLMPGCDILEGFHYLETLPPGGLFVAFYSSTDNTPPGRFEIGAGLRCELTYLDEAA